jgi:hypothetical protein
MQSDSDAMFTSCYRDDVIVAHHEEIIITVPITTFPDMLKRMHMCGLFVAQHFTNDTRCCAGSSC